MTENDEDKKNQAIKHLKPTANLRKVYEQTYKYGFELKHIDFELCLYRNFGNFDLEFSAINNQRRNFRKNPVRIYCWNGLRRGGSSIFAHIWCKSLDEVVELCKILDKYAKIHRPFELISFTELTKEFDSISGICKLFEYARKNKNCDNLDENKFWIYKNAENKWVAGTSQDCADYFWRC